MTEKEKIIEDLRAFGGINVKNTLAKLKMTRGNFYVGNYSLEKMQLVYDTLTDDLIKELKKQGKI